MQHRAMTISETVDAGTGTRRVISPDMKTRFLLYYVDNQTMKYDFCITNDKAEQNMCKINRGDNFCITQRSAEYNKSITR